MPQGGGGGAQGRAYRRDRTSLPKPENPNQPNPGDELCKRFRILVEGWGEGVGQIADIARHRRESERQNLTTNNRH
jgi:hypothetical protein